MCFEFSFDKFTTQKGCLIIMEEETAPKLVPIVVHSPVKVVPSETILKQESEKLRREAKEKLKNRAEKFGVKTVAEPIPGEEKKKKKKKKKKKNAHFLQVSPFL
jgi:hypothetical protein